MRHSRSFVALSCTVGLLAFAISTPTAEAYRLYSAKKVPDGCEDNGTCEPVGNCRSCHGDFRATDYRTPFKPWQPAWREVHSGEEIAGLHGIHVRIMLAGPGSPESCLVCHSLVDDELEYYPVNIAQSSTQSLSNESCMGCHGSGAERGGGAGLLQLHTNAGITECKVCHSKADPDNFTPAPEDVPPPNYRAGDSDFWNLPVDPCSRRDEDYAGDFRGLDNDGDGRYERFDTDCQWWADSDD